MGNKPSVAELPTEWEDVLPNVDEADIIRSSGKKCSIAEDKSVYLDDDQFDMDEHVPVALAILRAHPHLKSIRFKLVPGRMTEEKYWAALFGILHDGGIDMENVVGEIDDDYETGDEVDDNLRVIDEDALIPPEPLAQSPLENPGTKIHGKQLGPIAKLEHAYYDFDDNDSLDESKLRAPPSYLREMEVQKAHVARLQKSLREANHKNRKLAMELHRERKKRPVEGIEEYGAGGKEDNLGSATNYSRCDSLMTPERLHSGKWEMHPDCVEFLKLDDHLKENLRKEKEKKMNEVLSQMKFIVDTDDIKDSYGKWTCCGQEEYKAECAA